MNLHGEPAWENLLGKQLRTFRDVWGVCFDLSHLPPKGFGTLQAALPPGRDVGEWLMLTSSSNSPTQKAAEETKRAGRRILSQNCSFFFSTILMNCTLWSSSALWWGIVGTFWWRFALARPFGAFLALLS